MRAPSPPPFPRRLVPYVLTSSLSLVLAVGASGCGSSSSDDPGSTVRANGTTTGDEVLRVPSESMVPTAKVGQYVLVQPFSHPVNVRPAIGTIVVFNPPRGAEVGADRECRDADTVQRGRPCGRAVGGPSTGTTFLKRVVAGPGDTIAFVSGKTVRNGKPVDEPYVSTTCDGAGTTDTPCNLPHPITVPRDSYFLVGDNRGESNDSRFWGPVPRSWLIGQVTKIGVPAPKVGG